MSGKTSVAGRPGAGWMTTGRPASPNLLLDVPLTSYESAPVHRRGIGACAKLAGIWNCSDEICAPGLSLT
jgi:hypothetical protein